MALSAVMGLWACEAKDGSNGADGGGGGGDAGGQDDAGLADVAAPVVRFARPSAGESVSGEVAVLVEATDDIGVAEVVLSVDGADAVTLRAAPWEWTWDAGPRVPGTYVLGARARDSAGNEGAARVHVTVPGRGAEDGDGPPQSVRIVNPVDGAVVCGSVTVEVAATDEGGIARIEVQVDGVPLGADETSPYQVEWDTTAATDGVHTVGATARDAAGQHAVAMARVRVDNRAAGCDDLPTVRVEAPADGAFVRGLVEVRARASDDTGVERVRFFTDNGLIGDDGAIPYGIEWDTDGFEDGAHTLKAIAYDIGGQTASHQVGVTVDGTPPEVRLVRPSDGELFHDAVPVRVDATDNFVVRSVDVGIRGADAPLRLEGPPWEGELDVSGLPAGVHDLEATATDGAGGTATAGVSILIDRPPSVAFRSPRDGDVVEGPVTVEADASDDLGLVAVTLHVDGEPVGELPTDDLTFVWAPGQVAGPRALRLVATDGAGQEDADEITVTVGDPADGCDGNPDGVPLPGGGCCVPDCAGRQCGDNGCEGSCGECGEGEGCAAGECRRTCRPNGPIPPGGPGSGDSCQDPIDLGCLPAGGQIDAFGDTCGAGDDAPMCGGAEDTVYTFEVAEPVDVLVSNRQFANGFCTVLGFSAEVCDTERLRCDRYGCDFVAEIGFHAWPGVAYYVVQDGESGCGDYGVQITANALDPCVIARCEAGEACVDGRCVDPCADIRCGEGLRCSSGRCFPDACRNVDAPEGWACIGPGAFQMGSLGGEQGHLQDEVRHPVDIPRPFLLKTTEVTQGEWRAVFGNNPSAFDACGADCPVERVNWYEALEYANRLSDAAGLDRCYRLEGCNGNEPGTGLACGVVEVLAPGGDPSSCEGFRLPTEAEWEYAARAATDTAFHTGGFREREPVDCGLVQDLDQAGWYCGNSAVAYAGCADSSDWGGPPCAGTHPVGRKEANAWGLFDAHGNVWEWTWDAYRDDYEALDAQDPVSDGPADGRRVTRGGSWRNIAGHCRAATRAWETPGGRYFNVGFRLARSLP